MMEYVYILILQRGDRVKTKLTIENLLAFCVTLIFLVPLAFILAGLAFVLFILLIL